MDLKPKGVCPFCKKEINARVIQENKIRRDKCECSDCKSIIYVCRTPGCENYAKGGHLYDDELCPSCMSNIGRSIGALGTTALSIVVSTAVTRLLEKKMK